MSGQLLDLRRRMWKHQSAWRPATMVLVSLALLATSGFASARDYTLVLLDKLEGNPGIQNQANAINNRGQIVGGGAVTHGTFWKVHDEYGAVDLGALDGSYSEASALNEHGAVVGSHATAGGQRHATLWQRVSQNQFVATDLGISSGTTSSSSQAFGVNNVGQFVGDSLNSAGNTRATLWYGGTATDLGTLGGPNSFARGINNAGQIAGSSGTTGNRSQHATLWHGVTPVDLGTLGGTQSDAFAINEAGQVVGWSNTSGDTVMHAALWNGRTVRDLGTLAGFGGAYTWSRATAINDAGTVVGAAYIPGDPSPTAVRAVIWRGSAAKDLNNLLDPSEVQAGWFLRLATGINNHGSVVGRAYNTLTGEDRAFVLVREAR